jgi:outer membrane murein-binding lipoprotein Lpp
MKKLISMLFAALLFVGFAGCSFDDSNLWDSINSLEKRVETLEEKVDRMNTDIGAIQSVVQALNNAVSITNVETLATGHVIKFSNGSSITVNHGANGTNGINAPVIGVALDGGVYYWTSTLNGTTSWLTDGSDNKLPVTGPKGADGTNGSGVTPVLGVDASGYWTVDTGSGPEQLKDANDNPVQAAGENGQNGDSFFLGVTQNETSVTFTLANATVIVIPKVGTVTLTITGAAMQSFMYGETRALDLQQAGVEKISIAKPDGWRVVIDGGKLSVTAPDAANGYAEKQGAISIVATGKNNATTIASMGVYAGDYNYVMDFEDPRVADYLASDIYGNNLYTGEYVGYDDAGSGLVMLLNDQDYFQFWSGGIAISQWNDMTTADYTNQCSVYYRDAVTGFGGYGGSKTFAVQFGYDDTFFGYMSRTEIAFLDDQAEAVFDHFYVTNNTYAYFSMLTGDWVAKQFNYTDHDWFKLIVEGFDKGGTSTGTVEFYLADFRTPQSPGIITDWTRVDLSSLGGVNKIKFDMKSSDTGAYGPNTPSYFCFDNLAVKL